MVDADGLAMVTRPDGQRRSRSMRLGAAELRELRVEVEGAAAGAFKTVALASMDYLFV
jgi:hypothetical protein